MKSAQNLRLDITLTNYIIRMKKMTINGESLGGSQQGCLAVAQFLKDNYQFRRNVLNGKVEYVILNPEQADNQRVWRTLTPESMNSIVQKG